MRKRQESMDSLNAIVQLKIGIDTTFAFEMEGFDSLKRPSPLSTYVLVYRLHIMG